MSIVWVSVLLGVFRRSWGSQERMSEITTRAGPWRGQEELEWRQRVPGPPSQLNINGEAHPFPFVNISLIEYLYSVKWSAICILNYSFIRFSFFILMIKIIKMYPFYYFQVNPRHHIIPFQYVSIKDKRLFFPKYTYFKFRTLTLDIDLILSMWLLKRGEREKKKSKFDNPFSLFLRNKMKVIKISSWQTSKIIIYTAAHRLVTL